MHVDSLHDKQYLTTLSEETKEDYLSIPDRTKKYWIQTNVFFNYKLYKYYKIKLLDEYNIKELELAYGLLSDEFSKKMFINCFTISAI